MIVHIFPKEKFTAPFINLINENFNQEEHLFIIFGEHKNFDVNLATKYKNILDIGDEKNIFSHKSILQNASKIILHSLIIGKWMTIFFTFNKKLLAKSDWVIWGADLYGYKFRGKGIKAYINEKLKGRIIKNVSGLITHIEGDAKLAREVYKTNGIYKYSFMYKSNVFNEINLSSDEEKKGFTIQIGNSADPKNNHLEILDRLKVFKGKDIRIIVPLSYGPVDHANKVITYGKKLFGKKFEPIVDFMQYDEYLKLLNSVDIAIFNHERQQAVGNITNLLGLGKKVYIRSDITTWNFCKDHNLIVYDTLKSFKDIFNIDKASLVENKKQVRKHFSEKKLIECWKKIFDS